MCIRDSRSRSSVAPHLVAQLVEHNHLITSSYGDIQLRWDVVGSNPTEMICVGG